MKVHGNDTAILRWVRFALTSAAIWSVNPLALYLYLYVDLASQPARWLQKLAWPLSHSADSLRALSEEARKYSKALDALATRQARLGFEGRIAESLQGGDAWLHQFVRSECAAPSSCMRQGPWVTDPNELLHIHRQKWSWQWSSRCSVEYWPMFTGVCTADSGRVSARNRSAPRPGGSHGEPPSAPITGGSVTSFTYLMPHW